MGSRGAVAMNAKQTIAATNLRFKPYPAYKDSGVEWLGEIPAHWEVKRLRNISPSLGVGVVVMPSQ